MFSPLKHLFERVIPAGHLTVRDAHGGVHTFGDGTGPPIELHIHDHRVEWRIVRDPELAFGEAYVDGLLTVDRGSIYDFLDLAMGNMSAHPLPAWTQAFARLRAMKGGWSGRNAQARAAKNAGYHYDIDPRIYDLFLDIDKQYSCAYFAPGITALDDAQAAKKRHIAAKLRLGPGLRILDIGCGWGGMARYLAGLSQAHVTGITLSASQLHAALAHAPPPRGQTAFAREDYRSVKGTYDRIISVGMFEHVGPADYATYFSAVDRLLADDGIALVHAIGRLDGPATTNPFIAKWVFPGGALPALSEVTAAIEKSGLLINDIEILRLHYAHTLRAWRRRFMARRGEAAAIAGERFVRLWEFYLAGCEAAFRHQLLMVFQVQLTKKIDTLPITRDYMVEDERRLAAGAATRLRPLGQPPLRPQERRSS